MSFSESPLEWGDGMKCRRALHRGLAGVVRKMDVAGKPVLFDLGLAHELYAALIGPVESLVKDKRHLLVVPAGPLTSLPFHLLVTEEPATALPRLEDVAVYRDATWLIKRQAVTVLPSVASLKALRAFTRGERASKPMVGFGDPVFDPAERARGLAERHGQERKVAAISRGYSEFWRGAGSCPERRRHGLPSWSRIGRSRPRRRPGLPPRPSTS
jgi:hypothetical protein